MENKGVDIMERRLYGKLQIKGLIKALTGLHIGGSKETLEIGGIDSPVIKHPLTDEPFIPGSSLKGKVRSLLELNFEARGVCRIAPTRERRDLPMYMHVCKSWEQASKCPVCRIFGASGDSNFPARIRVRDSHLTPLWSKNLVGNFEYKVENAIDRITSAADPRTIERVPAGAEFEFEIIYNVENLDDLKDDIINLLTGLELLEDDYLGGYGSRGSGKVQFFVYNVTAKNLKYYFGQGEPRKVVDIKWNSEKTLDAPDNKELKNLRELKVTLIEGLDGLKEFFKEKP